MNKAQADEVFAANAVAMSGRDVIFDYKITELFGPDICVWAESCMGAEGYLDWSKDWGSWGDCGCQYFCKSGFDKLVSWHNYHVCIAEYRTSEGGKVWDRLWQKRHERMEAAEREEDRQLPASAPRRLNQFFKLSVPLHSQVIKKQLKQWRIL